ncbi:MAG: metallophosphoesterase [Candidatus Natronoplasma sp.]
MEPIWNERILKIDRTLVVADLHIGYERELEEKGINIPDQTDKMISSISTVLEREDAERLIINGDLKHNIPQGSWQEYRDIPKAVDEWLTMVDEVHLIPGNHDGSIERYVPSDVFIHETSGVALDEVGFFHGHAVPSKEVLSTGQLVLAHVHPAVALFDSFKNKQKKECWIRLKYDEGEAVVMPHFNRLLGGTTVNVLEDPYLGPFLTNNEFSEEKLYLLDGTYLGERMDLIPDQGL